MATHLLKLREVQRRLPRSRSTIYGEVAKGLFPTPVKIGRGSFWLNHEIDNLVAAYARGATRDELRRLCTGLQEQRLER